MRLWAKQRVSVDKNSQCRDEKFVEATEVNGEEMEKADDNRQHTTHN